MPELPEVETVLRTLEKQLNHTSITDIHVYYAKIIDNVSVDTFINELRNETFIMYHRIGKYMIFELQNHYLVVHLRMEGKFYIHSKDAPLNKHIHIVFDLADGRTLRYHDTRKFGRMYVYDKSKDYRQLDCFKNVGKDAFDETLTWKELYDVSRNKNITIKQFLLDQHYMAGVGNIYADEICYAIHLSPRSRVKKLSKKDFENMLSETRKILRHAIDCGGTTIRSYTSSLEVNGLFQLELNVHARENEECYVCHTKIKKVFIGGRGTYYCKTCQKYK